MSALDVKKHGGLDRSWRLSCRALLDFSYLGAHAASARMANAASSVILAPVSRKMMVRRLTPKRRASPACVRPSRSRRDLYSLASISQGVVEVGAVAEFVADLGKLSAGNRVRAVVAFAVGLAGPNDHFVFACGALDDYEIVFADFDALDGVGGHGRVFSFNVCVAQWQHTQGEVFSHRPQEKSEIISHGGFLPSPPNS